MRDPSDKAIELTRLIFTYVLAFVVVVGGGIIVFVQHDAIPSAELLPFLTFAMGSVLGYVFHQDGAAEAARRAALARKDEPA